MPPKSSKELIIYALNNASLSATNIPYHPTMSVSTTSTHSFLNTFEEQFNLKYNLKFEEFVEAVLLNHPELKI